jgi:hypothetical protein
MITKHKIISIMLLTTSSAHMAVIMACLMAMIAHTVVNMSPKALQLPFGEFRKTTTPSSQTRRYAWRESTMNRTELRLLVHHLHRTIQTNRLYCLPASQVGVPFNILVFHDGKTLINPVITERSNIMEQRDHTDFNDQKSKPLVPTWIKVQYTTPMYLEAMEERMEGGRAQCMSLLLCA